MSIYRVLPGLLMLILLSCTAAEQRPSELKPGERTTLQILSTTDLHGWVLPFDYATDQVDERYGLAKVATLIDSVRQATPNLLLLDAGDFLQGNQLAEYYAREDASSPNHPLLAAMELLEFDATVVGNHEFNFGVPYLDRRIAQHSVPVLGGNVYRNGTDEPYFKPFLIRNIGGVNVGVVGLTTPGSAVWDRPRVEGILRFGDGTEAAGRYVQEARAAGADIVVLLVHAAIESGSSYDIESVAMENFGRQAVETVPGIDALITAHSHRVVERLSITAPDGREIPVIQAGRWGSHLGIIELELEKMTDGSVQTVAHQSRAIAVTHAASHPDVTALMAASHEKVRGYVNQPVATTPQVWDASEARIKDTPIVDLIHYVQLEITGAQLSAASAFNLNARLGPGEITRRDLALIYPYENMLYTVELTGGQIRSYLEHTSRYFTGTSGGQPEINPQWPGFNFDTIAGLTYTMDIRQPVGERITDLRFQGSPVRDDQTFTVAMNSYRAEGGGGFNMLHDVPVRWKSEIPVRSYLETWLRDKEIVRHEDVSDTNWQLRF